MGKGQLNAEEQALVQAFEQGELVSVPNVEQVKKEVEAAAKNYCDLKKKRETISDPQKS